MSHAGKSMVEQPQNFRSISRAKAICKGPSRLGPALAAASATLDSPLPSPKINKRVILALEPPLYHPNNNSWPKMAPKKPEYPLYGPTFTLHRLSPLNVEPASPLLSKATLKIHAQRFGRTLKGDVLRGAHVGIGDDDEGLSRSGPLKECRWTLLHNDGQSTEDEAQEAGRNRRADGLGLTEGIHVEIEYEKMTHSALLLRSTTERGASVPGELYLPLMLSRMPLSLRGVFFDYVAVTFDTRIEAVYLSSQFTGNALEAFIGETLQEGPGALLKLVKDVQLSLGFKAPVHSTLRNLDVAIRKDDVSGFLSRGQAMLKESRDPAETVASRLRNPGAFMAAVHQYLVDNLALDMMHGDVYISKVACASFALGREGKVKLYPPTFADDDGEPPQSEDAASRHAVSRLIELLLSASKMEPKVTASVT